MVYKHVGRNRITIMLKYMLKCNKERKEKNLSEERILYKEVMNSISSFLFIRTPYTVILNLFVFIRVLV